MNDNTCNGRRKFLGQTLMMAAAAAVGPGCFRNMRDPGEAVMLRDRMSATDDPGPAALPPTRVYPDMPDAIVAMAGVGGSIERAVREAVEAAGGLKEIERRQRVMIKPNMCGPAIGDAYPGRITTNPEVLAAVIRLVRERGGKAIVGDRGQFMNETAWHTTGFDRVCKKEGAYAFPWTRADYVRFKPGKRHWSNGFRIPKPLAEADHFINVPILKNHQATAAEFTCCLKSFVGVCMPLDRWQLGSDALHVANISEKIAELNLSAKPLMNIVDATSIMVRGGPDGMKKTSIWVDANLILASRDRVACDSVALATLKRHGAERKVDLPYVNKSVWDQTQIYYSAELGIGQADPVKIKIEDVDVPIFDEIKGCWK